MSKRKKKKATQTCFISRNKAENWYVFAKLLAHSLLSLEEAIREFNKLSSKDRLDIQNAWKTLNEQRRIILKDVDKEEGEQFYFDLSRHHYFHFVHLQADFQHFLQQRKQVKKVKLLLSINVQKM